MNITWWRTDLSDDLQIAKKLFEQIQKITPEYDNKLKTLKEIIENKITNPINPWNRKLIIFTAFADTATYLYEELKTYNKSLWLETAMITWWKWNNTTLNIHKDFNNLLINFSPRSKHRSEKFANTPEIDVLIATDCISEWQNLQDCDYLINYDIHRNPVRIIQRFGRIDRIWSQNQRIQLLNFWPQLSLDDYINLKSRVENKMFIVDATATGEDNVLTNESSDLNFRKQQLERLQDEVIDLEDMDNSISITDLGLNDFRMDLLEYIKTQWDLSNIPHGMHSVSLQDPARGIVPGVIYILKNINPHINIDRLNNLHPYYIVYTQDNGEIRSNHLNIKQTLDILRLISKWKSNPIKEAYEIFNEATNDGKDMEKYSNLLNQTIESIISVKEESDIESLFTPWGTNIWSTTIQWLQDFELIAFNVII